MMQTTSRHVPIVDIKAVLLDEVDRFRCVEEHKHPSDVLNWKGSGPWTYSVSNVQGLQGLSSDLHTQGNKT